MGLPSVDRPSSIVSRQWGATILCALLTAVVIGCYAGWSAWTESQSRHFPMDIDGWGSLVKRLKVPGAGPATLLSDPSLWRGPVVPFVFGLCYYSAPYDEAVLVL